MVDPTFLKIQILNRPQIHKSFSLFLSLVQVKKKKPEYEFSMRSPAEMDKTCPVLTMKMSLHYQNVVVSQVHFQILRLLFEIASLRVCAQVRIG